MRNGADVIGAIIFALMAIIHLARFLCHFDVTLANYVVPDWVSPVSFVFFGLLAAWLLRPRTVLV
jgi:hypothetical protein